jgi:hypothetical protein
MDSELMRMSTTESDHSVILTLPGGPESLRPRLADALERLGYKIITEEPLYARRRARGCARWDCSFETLDYSRKVAVSLKPQSDAATLVTFSYEIRAFSGLTRGDRQTLQREAEALTALAMQRTMVNSCAACGTEVTDDSRFCRRCGAPLDIEVPEVEVLRLTQSARRAHHNLTLGLVVLVVALLLPLVLILIDTSKAYKVVALLSSVFGVIGLLALMQGLWQLHRTLNPPSGDDTRGESVKRFAAPQTRALGPRPIQLSVTEGTTELFVSPQNGRIAVPVAREAADTSEVK